MYLAHFNCHQGSSAVKFKEVGQHCNLLSATNMGIVQVFTILLVWAVRIAFSFSVPMIYVECS